MQSEENESDTKNEALIRAYYAAFNRQDSEGMLALLSDDVIHEINQGERTRGKEAFRHFLEDMALFYEERLEDIHIMTEKGGQRAAAEFLCLGVYRRTAPGLPPARQQSYALTVACIFEVREGKIARVSNAYNLADWLRQVQ